MSKIFAHNGHPYLSNVPSSIYDEGHLYTTHYDETGRLVVTVAYHYYKVEANREDARKLTQQVTNFKNRIKDLKGLIGVEEGKSYPNGMLMSEMKAEVEKIEGGLAEAQAKLDALVTDIEEKTYPFDLKLPQAIGFK